MLTILGNRVINHLKPSLHLESVYWESKTINGIWIAFQNTWIQTVTK